MKVEDSKKKRKAAAALYKRMVQLRKAQTKGTQSISRGMREAGFTPSKESPSDIQKAARKEYEKGRKTILGK